MKAAPKLTRPEGVVHNAHSVAARLVSDGNHYGLTAAEVRFVNSEMAVFWLTLEPWAGPAAENYLTERAAITVWVNGRVVAVPVDARDRAWLHRNAYRPLRLDLLGELCLWFPGDPRNLRWEWSDGFGEYVTMVHRHLQAEECWRRTEIWPSEDAPHGDGPHPVRTAAMRRLANEAA